LQVRILLGSPAIFFYNNFNNLRPKVLQAREFYT